MNNSLVELFDALAQLEQDSSLPKNVKLKLQSAISVLKEEGTDMKIKVNKALQHLEDVSDDSNMPSYIRPQIWNIVSMLESL